MHKHFSQSAIPQWPCFVANPEYHANDPDYSLAYLLCFATSQHAHNQHLQTSATHMQNQIHKDKNFKHNHNFQSCFTFEPGKLIQAKSNIANILPKNHIRIVVIKCRNSKLNPIKKQSKNKETRKQQRVQEKVKDDPRQRCISNPRQNWAVVWRIPISAITRKPLFKL